MTENGSVFSLVITNIINQMRYQIFMAFMLAPFASMQAQDHSEALLDVPLRLTACGDYSTELDDFSRRLIDEDKFYFELAYSAISVEFLVGNKFGGISLSERKRAFVASLDGLSARRIIIIGIILRSLQYNGRDDFAQALHGDELKKRRDHMIEEGREANRLAEYVLIKYSANQ